MTTKQEKPFIHTFKAGNQYYLFDVNTDQILCVSKEIYDFFEKEPTEEDINNIEDTKKKEYIFELQKRAFLRQKGCKKVSIRKQDLFPVIWNQKSLPLYYR